jgi:hypothetical protein
MTFRTLLGIGLLVGVSSLRADILVTEVMSSSAHPSDGTANDDWFELTNTGLSSIDITGWSWDDDSHTAGSANFGSLTSIGAGQSVIITGEAKGTEAAWLTDWGISGVTVVALGNATFQAFGANGDQVNIYNSSNALVTSVSFGIATQGSSFAWDAGGNSLGISVVGQNGAFKAVLNGGNAAPGPGQDIGSPGYVSPVPEPGTVALLGAGVGLVLYGFRRRHLLR